MNDDLKALAAACLQGAAENSMDFPAIVGTLMQAGFESYLVDFRRAAATYYLPDGQSLDLPLHDSAAPVAAAFDAPQLQAVIAEAQQAVPGYTYKGFCRKAAAAGCAGYLVSFSGRQALYFGRTGETHVERFPDRAPD